MECNEAGFEDFDGVFAAQGMWLNGEREGHKDNQLESDLAARVEGGSIQWLDQIWKTI